MCDKMKVVLRGLRLRTLKLGARVDGNSAVGVDVCRELPTADLDGSTSALVPTLGSGDDVTVRTVR